MVAASLALLAALLVVALAARRRRERARPVRRRAAAARHAAAGLPPARPGRPPVALRRCAGRAVVVTFLYSLPGHLPGEVRRSAARSTTSATTCRCSPSASTRPTTRPRARRRFLLQQQLTRGRMRFLLGTPARSSRRSGARYGIPPQGRDFDHSAYVVLVDRRGRQRIGFPVDQLTPEGLAHDLRRLEREPA